MSIVLKWLTHSTFSTYSGERAIKYCHDHEHSVAILQEDGANGHSETNPISLCHRLLLQSRSVGGVFIIDKQIP